MKAVAEDDGDDEEEEAAADDDEEEEEEADEPEDIKGKLEEGKSLLLLCSLLQGFHAVYNAHSISNCS